MTYAEQVAAARTHADAGDHERAASLLYALAAADSRGDIGYAERMRWGEVQGVLERAGFDLRGAFLRFRDATPRTPRALKGKR